MSNKITGFTKGNLPAIRTTINDALSRVLREAYGITAEAGHCNFDNSEATLKLVIKIDDPKVQEISNQHKFNMYCRSFGLRPEDYGSTIVTAGKRITLVGILPKRIKYPFQMRDENGKVMLYTDVVVERIRAATDAGKVKA